MTTIPQLGVRQANRAFVERAYTHMARRWNSAASILNDHPVADGFASRVVSVIMTFTIVRRNRFTVLTARCEVCRRGFTPESGRRFRENRPDTMVEGTVACPP